VHTQLTANKHWQWRIASFSKCALAGVLAQTQSPVTRDYAQRYPLPRLLLHLCVFFHPLLFFHPVLRFLFLILRSLLHPLYCFKRKCNRVESALREFYPIILSCAFQLLHRNMEFLNVTVRGYRTFYVSGKYANIYSFGSMEQCLRHNAHFMAIKNLSADIDEERTAANWEGRNDYADYAPWLRMVDHFIAHWGEDYVPPDIKDAMRSIEYNLGLPITFPAPSSAYDTSE